MLAVAGTLPIMAGLGALIGRLEKKKKKTQEGSGASTVPAQAGQRGWGDLALRNQSSQQRANMRPDRRDTQPVRQRGAPAHAGQTALEKAYKRDLTF